MNHNTVSSDTDEMLWQGLMPHLDQAVAALSEADRSAILLKFYEKMPLHKVGERLGVSEEAAKKRVSRAVEKMRRFLDRRGVKLSGLSLTGILAEKTVQAASAELASAVAKISLAAASASASIALPQLAQHTLRAWHWAKVKLLVGLSAGSMALLFVAMSVSGLRPRPATAPSVVNDLQGAAANAVTTGQLVAAFPAPITDAGTQASKKTGAVTGTVMDGEGHPIVGAQVWAGFDSAPIAQDTTDQSGQFALDRIEAPPFVTVTADGFAADQQKVDLTNVPGALVFRLSPTLPLRVSVVDELGQAVGGARWFLQEWWGRSGTLGQLLAQQMDSDGRWQWSSAPKGELELSFSKSGYRYSRANKFAADGEEHIVVLHPTATVTGSVTDAETAVPVASFKLTMGHSQMWNPQDPLPMWELHGKSGSNGFYKILIDEEQVPYMRIEAEGYETVESQITLTNAVAATRDFQLKRQNPINSIRGTVLLPDGSPAAGIEVALCTAQVGVMLKGTAFEPEPFGTLGRAQKQNYRKQTDEQGRFLFDPQPGAHTLAAVSLAGLGQVRCFDFSKPIELRLQSWGRVEGNVRTRDGQWGDRKVKWGRRGNLTSWMTVFYGSEEVRSDATGKFTLEHVPPGDGHVVIDDGPDTARILSTSIHVKPGETVEVQVGGVGSAVIGKLVAPPGVEIRNWPSQVSAELTVEWPSYPLPQDLKGNAAERWKLEWEDTEAGRAWFRDRRRYDFRIGADGSFSVPEVLAGKYFLFVNVARGYLGSGADATPRDADGPRVASIAKKLTVPDTASGAASPVDLGEIQLIADH